MPEFSILMPSHNYSRFLPEAIESVLDQTYGDFELVVLDDASTDNSWSIITGYDDPRIVAVRSESNRRLGPTLNAAFAASSGRFVGVVNADDRLPEDALQRYHEAFAADPGTDIVGSYLRTIDAEGNPMREDATADFYNKHQDFDDPRIWVFRNALAGNSFIRREKLQAIGGFSEGMDPIVDWDEWLRAVAVGARIRVLPEVLYEWRDHGTNITGSDIAWTILCYMRLCRETFHPYLRSIGRRDLVLENLSLLLRHDAFVRGSDDYVASVLDTLLSPAETPDFAAACRALADRAESTGVQLAEAVGRADQLADDVRRAEALVAARDGEIGGLNQRLQRAEEGERSARAELDRIRSHPAFKAAKRARGLVRRKP